jgi:hypothetical protein
MTDTMTSQNIVLSSWDTLYVEQACWNVSTGKGVPTSEERNTFVMIEAVCSSDIGTHVHDHMVSQQRETQYGFHHFDILESLDINKYR